MKLFDPVNKGSTKPGAPPLVFVPTPDSHIVFKTADELKEFEDSVRERLGVKLRGEVGSASESCSGGCSDDCD